MAVSENNPTGSRKYTLGDLARLMYLPAAFMISFDIFLVFPLGGLNIRTAQIFLLIPMTLFALGTLRKGRVKRPIGFAYLLIWTAFILTFIPNTNFLLRSVGYGFWLIYSVILILTTVNLFDTNDRIYTLTRWYIYSFLFVAIFGLIQFAMAFLHLGAPLLVQWFIPGVLPRINGFCYEPSFFCTYMLMGWILTAYLVEAKSDLIRRNILIPILITLTAAMIMSGSRIGFLMILLWYLHYPFLFVVRLTRGKINKTHLKRSVAVILLMIPIIFMYFFLVGLDRISVLMSGLGIVEGGRFSVEQRMVGFAETREIFLKSPFIGYSLGGIPEAIGRLRGVDVNSVKAAKENEGFCVFAEVLAASGIFGFIPFVLYIVSLIVNPVKLALGCLNIEMPKLLMGVTLALIFELIILQFNQNILRPYLWFHIALLSALYSVSLRPERAVDAGNRNLS